MPRGRQEGSELHPVYSATTVPLMASADALLDTDTNSLQAAQQQAGCLKRCYRRAAARDFVFSKAFGVLVRHRGSVACSVARQKRKGLRLFKVQSYIDMMLKIDSQSFSIAIAPQSYATCMCSV
eukprot:SAG11_NODE_1741_length_4336_cov_1.517583_2_plen_124_part_00